MLPPAASRNRAGPDSADHDRRSASNPHRRRRYHACQQPVAQRNLARLRTRRLALATISAFSAAPQRPRRGQHLNATEIGKLLSTPSPYLDQTRQDHPIALTRCNVPITLRSRCLGYDRRYIRLVQACPEDKTLEDDPETGEPFWGDNEKSPIGRLGSLRSPLLPSYPGYPDNADRRAV